MPALETTNANPHLRLSAAEHAELAITYGANAVADALASDRFDNIAALRRQLKYESTIEITLLDYHRIAPFAVAGDHDIERSSEAVSHQTLLDVALVERQQCLHADGEVSRVKVARDAMGDRVMLDAFGRFAVPEGWIAEDSLRRDASGLTKLRTRFIGPNGESGMVVRSFDGATLHLDKAYKSTLPTRLNGVPGFERPVTTVNYMTARACKILGVTHENLKQIKVNRVQHRPMLAQLDWLRRTNPGMPMEALVDRTTWAKSYIRQTGDILGLCIAPNPKLDLEGSPTWQAAHPDAQPREWCYLEMEAQRQTYKHVTGEKIARVDDLLRPWQISAAEALLNFESRECAGLSPIAAAQRVAEIKTLIQNRLVALGAEGEGLRSRYGMHADQVPQHFNFDVTYRTTAPGA